MFATHLELGKLAILRKDKQSIVVQKPEVFLRNRNGTEERVDYVFPSRRMYSHEAEERIKDLEDKNITVMPYGSRQKVFLVHADNKREFSNLGQFGYFPDKKDVSLEQILRWRLNFPFPEVEYLGGEQIDDKTYVGGKVSFTGKKAPLEELLNEIIMAIDIETVDFMPYEISDLRVSNKQIRDYLEANSIVADGSREGLIATLQDYRNANLDPQIFSTIVTSTTGANYLLWKFYGGERRFNSEAGSLDLRLVEAMSPNELVDKLNAIESEIDPLAYIGSNIAFDLEHLRATGIYSPGKYGSAPKKRSRTVGVITPMRINGSYVLDMVGIAQHGMPQTPNNRLNTVANHGLDLRTSKPNDYRELALLELESELGSGEAKEEFLNYCGPDGLLPLEFGKNFWKPLILVSMMMGQDPSVISTTSRKEVAQKLWEYKHFMQLNTIGGRVYGRAFEDFTLENLTLELLNKEEKTLQLGFFGNKEVKGKKQLFQSKRGVYENARMLHLTPFIKASEPIIAYDSYALNVYQEMHRTEKKAVKLMLALYLEAYLENPMWELKRLEKAGENLMAHPRDGVSNIRDFNLSDWIFGQRYGINAEIEGQGANIYTINNKAHYALFGNTVKGNHVPGLSDYLSKLSMINYSDHFILATHPDNETLGNTIEEMVNKDLAIDMGSGTALSLTTGRYAAMIDGLVTTQGFDIHARRGYKTFWEKEFIPEFVQLVLEGKKEEALEYMVTANKLINLGLVDDKLVFASRAGKDAYAYSSLARMQERIGHYEKINAEKGQLVEQRLDGLSAYQNRWYGSMGPQGRKLSEGPLGDLLLSVFPEISKNKTMAEAVVNGGMESIPGMYSTQTKI